LFAVRRVALDHTVIHVSDWERSNAFYSEVLGAELVENPEAVANPLGGWAYRFGDQQLNVHGPWPGKAEPCCPPEQARPGSSDLGFAWPGPIEEAITHLERFGIPLEEGPVERFGARGTGRSIYCRDPDGSLIELVAYER
jgi:catechol 2,3-dioxygenase-like lactoylglutathione lyase family enzyme